MVGFTVSGEDKKQEGRSGHSGRVEVERCVLLW